MRRIPLRWPLGVCTAALALVTASCSTPASPAAVQRVTGGPTGRYIVPAGIHKIKHVVVVMQENRSFDSYFGTYPGADGIPMKNGAPSVCVNNPQTGQCVAPYVDHADVNGGGPHSAPNATASSSVTSSIVVPRGRLATVWPCCT